MKYVYLTLNWLTGVLFLLIGMISMATSALAGLCLLAAGCFLLPPIRNFVYSKTRKDLSPKARAAAVLVLLIAYFSFFSHGVDQKMQKYAAKQKREKAEKTAMARQQDIDYFNTHRAEIISSVKTAFENKEYQAVVSQSNKFRIVNDKELQQFDAKAKKELAAIRKAENAAKEKARRAAETKKILAQLKNIPASQIQKNKDMYQRLVANNPGVEEYKKKLDYYSEKFKDQQEQERLERIKRKKERQERLVKFGPPPKQSGWDGSYSEVERYLKQVAHDPDSIDISGCTEVYHTEKGWLVGCDYRGRNGFGGLIRQSNWFTIAHGRVTQMHDASAYKP